MVYCKKSIKLKKAASEEIRKSIRHAEKIAKWDNEIIPYQIISLSVTTINGNRLNITNGRVV